jgi:hypothetical protein
MNEEEVEEKAVISCMAGEALPRAVSPTLLIVGGLDDVFIRLNEEALGKLQCVKNMKRLLLLIAILFVTALANSNCAIRPMTLIRPAGPPQRVVVDVSVFYDELSPYGRWFMLEGYGWGWTPYGVSASWRPYTYGYWVYTDYGWTWVSRWRWGWAPFHYGRWIFHRHHGWVWKPGRVWAPAWVVWRHRPGWIGWAPMPPQAEWHDDIGLRARWDEIDMIVEPHWYSFVEERHFPAENLDSRLDLPSRNWESRHQPQRQRRSYRAGVRPRRTAPARCGK